MCSEEGGYAGRISDVESMDCHFCVGRLGGDGPLDLPKGFKTAGFEDDVGGGSAGVGVNCGCADPCADAYAGYGRVLEIVTVGQSV